VPQNPQEDVKSSGNHICIRWEHKLYNTVHPITVQYAISTVRFVFIYLLLFSVEKLSLWDCQTGFDSLKGQALFTSPCHLKVILVFTASYQAGVTSSIAMCKVAGIPKWLLTSVLQWCVFRNTVKMIDACIQKRGGKFQRFLRTLTKCFMFGKIQNKCHILCPLHYPCILLFASFAVFLFFQVLHSFLV
jgi:hypothetical protein